MGGPCRGCSGRGGLSRRDFLARLPLIPAAAQLAAQAFFEEALAAQERKSLIPQARDTSVRVVFLRLRGDSRSWPGGFWDPEAHRKKYTADLQAVARQLGINITFEQEPVYDKAGAAKVAEKLNAQRPDGTVLVLLHRRVWGAVEPFTASGIPTIIYAPMGTAFHTNFSAPSRLVGVYGVSSIAGMNSVRFGLKMLKAMRQMREAKIVVLRGTKTRDSEMPGFGTKVRTLPRGYFVEVFNKIQPTEEIRRAAAEYAARAREVVLVSEDDILFAYRTYVTARKILEDEGGNAITMDCLGNIGPLGGVPCVGWSLLLDEGVPAACEADMNAMLAHMLVEYLFDRPGFQQDPVPDTETNLFIGSHCMCATKLRGIDKPSEPFILRPHHWYRKTDKRIGVGVQVLWREGQMITIVDFEGPSRLLIGRGRVVGNLTTGIGSASPPIGGCCNNVVARIYGHANVRDCRGFHQLLFYGDHYQQLRDFCQLFGLEWVHI